jgi:hypothetical protein
MKHSSAIAAVAFSGVALLSAVLTVDVVVLPRLSAGDCYVFGRAADAMAVDPGARVDPDSGGCEAFQCSRLVTSVDRVVLPRYVRVEEYFGNC